MISELWNVKSGKAEISVVVSDILCPLGCFFPLPGYQETQRSARGQGSQNGAQAPEDHSSEGVHHQVPLQHASEQHLRELRALLPGA